MYNVSKFYTNRTIKNMLKNTDSQHKTHYNENIFTGVLTLLNIQQDRIIY